MADAKKLTTTEKQQHTSVLRTAAFNLQSIIDGVETLNDQANYDSLLEYLDSAKNELSSSLKKVG